MLYLEHSFGGSNPSTEKQSVYSTAPADWAILNGDDDDDVYIYIYIYICVCIIQSSYTGVGDNSVWTIKLFNNEHLNLPGKDGNKFISYQYS